MQLKLATPPASEPVSLADLKLHLRVDIPDDDTLIAALLSAARQRCEAELARSFVATAWTLYLEHFPVPEPGLSPLGWTPQYWSLERVWPGSLNPIRVPRADLIAVQSITYVEPAGDTVTLDPSQYQVQAGAPGLVVPAYGKTWPAARNQLQSVAVNFTAGYGPDGTSTPACLLAAIKLLVGHLYEHREAASDLSLAEIPLGVKTLLATEDWGFYA